MEFTMYDYISPSTTQSIINGLRELRKKDSDTIEIKLNILGPVGDEVEEWILTGKIKKVNFGKLDYSDYSNALFVTLYFSIYSAILNY